MKRKFTALALGLMGLLVLMAVPSMAQEEQESRLESLFNRMDTNNDGLIDREEFRGNDEMFNRMDTDGSGTLTFEEFAAGWRTRMEQRPRAARDPRSATGEAQGRARVERREVARQVRGATGAEARFAALDRDNDGLLSREEFPGTDEMFDLFDQDEDGYLTFEEFEAGMAMRRERRDTRQEESREAPPRAMRGRGEGAPRGERPIPIPDPMPRPEPRRGGRGR